MAALRLGRRRFRRLALPALLLFTYFLSTAWALATPVPVGRSAGINANFQPDEASHIAVIEYMADYHALPPYQRPFDTSVHPPLYHALGAIVFALAASSAGETRALLAVRLLTALCGVGTVYLTYAAGRRLASRSTALLAAALVALVPMRASIGGGITNENLAALGAAGVFAMLIGGWADRRRGFSSWKRIALLAAYLIVGVGSKVTCLGLIPLAVLSILWEARERGRALARAVVAGMAPLAAWGWWFERNREIYGDFFRKTAADRLWDRVQPGFAILHMTTGESAFHYAQILTTRSWLSFWGVFDGFRTMMPWPIYAALATFQICVLAGLARLAAAHTPWIRRCVAAAFVVMSGAFALSVALVFYRFNWSHCSPQGRYYFVLLAPFGVFSAVGWRAIWAPATSRARAFATPSLIVLLCLLNLWCLCRMPG